MNSNSSIEAATKGALPLVLAAAPQGLAGWGATQAGTGSSAGLVSASGGAGAGLVAITTGGGKFLCDG
jgi:hypothetical protein